MRARVLIIAIFLLSNCKDPINLEGEGSTGVVVIDGKVTTLPGPYELRLGLTVGINQTPNPLSFAIATLYDDLGNSEQYQEIKPGIYQIPGAVIQGTAGHTYHVEITLQDGRTYTSKAETIPAATGIDTPSFDFGERSEFLGEAEVKTNVMNIYADSQLPSNERDYYFRWDVLETYMFEQSPVFNPITGGIPNPCYVEGYADRQRITLFSTRNQPVQTLKHTLVAVRDIDYSFQARHYFHIYMSSITKESYNYWKNVDQLINRSGSIFDTPPAPIVGNVHSTSDDTEKVFGYFEVTNTSLSRFYVLRGDVPFPMNSYCNDSRYGPYWWGYPKECNDCLLLENSSSTPPAWWIND